MKKLSSKYVTIHSANIEFVQTSHLTMIKKEQTFTGVLQMKQGNKFRITMEHQTIVTDGKTVWSYSAANNQVLIDNYKEDAQSFSPEKILLHAPDNFYSTFLRMEQLKADTLALVKLTPKDERSLIASMKIWIDGKDSLMKKVELTDASNNITSYLISSIKVNTLVAEDVFRFVPPPQTEVIDLR
jgi:chaperone LolA